MFKNSTLSKVGHICNWSWYACT